MSIQDYWANQLQELAEFKLLAAIEDEELGSVGDALAQLLDDQFIADATEKGIARRERMLKITPFADDTLETRRFRVQSRWNSKLPYTYTGLIEKLDQMCGADGYALTLNHNAYSLRIRIELTQKRLFGEVEAITHKMVPANIGITVELRYRQHKELTGYTHGQLKAYRQTQLREENLV